MARIQRLVILLDEEESNAIDELAQLEKLRPSTLARRYLLLEAEKRGITPLTSKYTAFRVALSATGTNVE
jgi:hypothetical protein